MTTSGGEMAKLHKMARVGRVFSPGAQTAVFHLPEKQTTMVVFTNTNVNSRGSDSSAILATAITTIVTPAKVNAVPPH